MEETIVKSPTAKLLKEIGFNLPVPTQTLAQKYLRENHNIDITIHRSFSMSKSYHYYIIIDGNYEVDEDNIQECIPNRSYEQALEDALVKALTLIKNKIV